MNKSYIIDEPASEQAFLVSASDWERLDEAARQAALQGSWLNYFASLLIGVGSAGLYIGLQLRANEEAANAFADWYLPAIWAATVVCFVLAAVFLVVARRDKRQLLTEMDRVKKASSREEPSVQEQEIFPTEEQQDALRTTDARLPGATHHARWAIGDKIHHEALGTGIVQDVDGPYVTVAFRDGTERRIFASYAPITKAQE